MISLSYHELAAGHSVHLRSRVHSRGITANDSQSSCHLRACGCHAFELHGVRSVKSQVTLDKRANEARTLVAAIVYAETTIKQEMRAEPTWQMPISLTVFERFGSPAVLAAFKQQRRVQARSSQPARLSEQTLVNLEVNCERPTVARSWLKRFS